MNWSLFWTSKKIRNIFIIYLLISTVYLIVTFIRNYVNYGDMYETYALTGLLLVNSPISFAVYIVLSYEYMSHVKRSRLEECISVNRKSFLKGTLTRFLILMSVLLMYVFIVLTLQYITYKAIGTARNELMVQILQEIILYCFLPNVIAIMLGTIFSGFASKTAYVFIIGITAAITISYYSSQEVEIGSWLDAFNILPITNRYVLNYAAFEPITLHFWSKPCMWIAVLTGIMLAVVMKGRLRLLGMVLVIPFLVSLHAFLLPSSGYYSIYVQPDMSENDSLPKDTYSDFKVEEYNMELSVDRELTAGVDIKVSEPNLDYYAFTLFSGYVVDKVCGEDGTPLKYYRNKDHLVVEGVKDGLRVIHMDYHGAGTLEYYSGSQGTYLQGNFPYYPMEGLSEIYEIGLCELPRELSKYHVTVDSKLPMHSNLDKVSENEFSGMSNNVTLYASKHIIEEEIEGRTYIYPNSDVALNLRVNSWLYNGIKDFVDKDVAGKRIDYDFNDKKFVIMPTWSFVKNYMFGSDCIVLQSMRDLEMYYTNYVQTGNWYREPDVTMPDNVKKALEEIENEAEHK